MPRPTRRAGMIHHSILVRAPNLEGMARVKVEAGKIKPRTIRVIVREGGQGKQGRLITPTEEQLKQIQGQVEKEVRRRLNAQS